MKHSAIFIASVAMLAISSQAADTPNGSTNAPAATNAPHFSSKFAERLHQLKEHDRTNAVVLPPPIPRQPPRFNKQPEHKLDELLPERRSRTPRYPPISGQTNQCQTVSHDAA